MKKKHFILVFLFVFIGLIKISNNVKGDDLYILYNLETDKETYFIDDEILINVSWYLDYDPGEENSSLQIQIFNIFNDMLWNSPWLDEVGNFTENFTVNIQDLNISFSNYSNILYVKMCYDWQEFIPPLDSKHLFIETFEIQIIKREALCNLINITDPLIYSDNLYFKANFYDKFRGNNSPLYNQTILSKLYSDDLVTYEKNLTTNTFGIVELNVSSLPYFGFGANYLIFALEYNKVYNDTVFFYTINITRIPILIELISFNGTLKEEENLKFKAFYYYYFNYSVKILKNISVQLKIYSGDSLKYQNGYKINSSGILLINLPYKSLNITQKDNRLTIKLIYNGTSYLEKKTVILYIELSKISSSETDHSIQLLTFSIVPVLVVLSTFLSLISYNNKNLKQIPLREITFKF